MSLGRVKKGLRELPYLEMEALTGQVIESLRTTEGAKMDSLGKILATLPLEDSEQMCREEEVLRSLFTRKLSITITPVKTGVAWEIGMPTGGPAVLCNDLRGGIMEYLDTLVAYLALEK
ncbi:MAG: hypothetical protein KAJ55_09075 [Anaerolineales bacterium]|nr:hypothetical protein [Anaerolineales bacterium]